LSQTKARNDKRRREPLDFKHLNEHLGYFLGRLQAEVSGRFVRRFSAFRVPPAQYSVLILIGDNPGRTQAEIGEALNIERAALAKMLHRLERRGWIKRLVNDGRSHSLVLTASGRRTLKRLLRIGRRHEANIERLVGPRRRQQLIGLLKDFG